MDQIFQDLQATLDVDPAALARAAGFAALLVLALLLHAAVFRAIRRYAASGDDRHTARFVASLKWPTRLATLAIAAGLAVPLLDLAPSLAAPLRRIAHLLTVAAVGWALMRTVYALRDRSYRRFPIDMADNLANRKIRTQIGVLVRIATIAIVLVSGAVMLLSIPAVREFGVSLLASAGIAGLVVGMAARPALSNLIAGVQIALAQPIRIDDVVIVEGEWGWIEEIAMTYVVVRIWDERRLIVPLSHFIENPFQNWTRQSAQILGTIFLHVDYTVPVEAVRKAFREATEASRYWDKRVCVLHVTEAKETTLEIRLLVSAATSPQAWELRCEVREKMVAWLQAEYPEALPRARIEIAGPRGPAETPDAREIG